MLGRLIVSGNGKVEWGGGMRKKREKIRVEYCQQLGFNLKLDKMVGELVKGIITGC